MGCLKLTYITNLDLVTNEFKKELTSNFSNLREQGGQDLTNHLGNVLATITDRKVYNSTDGYYEPVITMKADYYAFGMLMPGRFEGISDTRHLFNGMEQDMEVSGEGNSYTTEFRQYDPRLGRWKSLDPLMSMFPNMSPYVGFANNPIFFTDPYGLAPTNGDEGEPVKTGSGREQKDGSFDGVDQKEETTVYGKDKSKPNDKELNPYFKKNAEKYISKNNQDKTLADKMINNLPKLLSPFSNGNNQRFTLKTFDVVGAPLLSRGNIMVSTSNTATTGFWHYQAETGQGFSTGVAFKASGPTGSKGDITFTEDLEPMRDLASFLNQGENSMVQITNFDIQLILLYRKTTITSYPNQSKNLYHSHGFGGGVGGGVSGGNSSVTRFENTPLSKEDIMIRALADPTLHRRSDTLRKYLGEHFKDSIKSQKAKKMVYKMVNNLMIVFMFSIMGCSSKEPSKDLIVNDENLDMLKSKFFPTADISVLNNEVIIDYSKGISKDEEVYFSSLREDILYLIVANSIIHTTDLKGIDSFKVTIKKLVNNEPEGVTISLDTSNISTLRNSYKWNTQIRDSYAFILMECQNNTIYSLSYSTIQLRKLSENFTYDKSFWFLLHDFTDQINNFENFDKPRALVYMWTVLQYCRMDNVDSSFECVEKLFSINGFNLKDKGLLNSSFEEFVTYIDGCRKKNKLD